MSLAFFWPNSYLVKNDLRCSQAVKRCLYELRKIWAMKQQESKRSSEKLKSERKKKSYRVLNLIRFVVPIIINYLGNG